MNSLIRLENISKIIDNKKILKDINFEIQNGEIFGIIGKNGAGKTTLLRILIGFYHYNGGKYYIYNDEKIPLNKDFLKSNFGFASQENCFYDGLTVFENIKYFGKMYFMKKNILMSKIEEVLELVDLKEQKNTLASNLSGGMKRRLDLACALIHSPHVLILDEPTAELDPVTANHLWRTLKNINESGTTIILSSHFLNKVDHLCDHIAIIDDGYILETGTPKELKELYSHNEELILQTFPGHYQEIVNYLNAYNLAISKTQIRDKSLVIYTKDAGQVLEVLIKLLNDLREKILELEVNKPSLNEIFESVTANKPVVNKESEINRYIKDSVEKYKNSELKKKLLESYPKETVEKILSQK
ncbi:MAG: ABC transporter ATP-binding protein [Nanoarchaeota archaeon]|nr:ABC transporter ATP-binding protein [Nanoarchaeota archaeon]MBU1029650.1 ABC transporter ATP-binding protein [Nanoarchaeota archaeon]MBU1849180.1 ABC transporter ATP-binding protein [Nanoarchaeota archaeon]